MSNPNIKEKYRQLLDLMGQCADLESELHLGNSIRNHYEELPLTYSDLAVFRASEARQDRESKLEAVRELAEGASHELNNMLTVIIGQTDQICRESDDPKLLESLRPVEEAARRANRLTAQLLAFGRRERFMPRDFFLHDLVKKFSRVLEREAGEAVVQVEAPDTIPKLRLDPGMIEQVLLNLVRNARQAGASNINIVVDEQKDRSAVRLIIKDDGRGIPEEELTRVFDPFFTTNTTRLGLGLSTVYGILRRHSGVIQVRSIVGEGTTFTVSFPVRELETGVPKAPQNPKPALQAHGETVLLVEDDDLVRDVAESMLRDSGYEVLAAAGADEALRVAEEAKDIALLLTDLVMPGRDGFELAKSFQERFPEVPILFTSGHSEELANRRRDNPQIQFIGKPYGPDKLAEAVHRALHAG